MTNLEELNEKVRRAATERGLTSVMNDTKWREVCRLFQRWTPFPSFRIRGLFASGDYVSSWDGEWYHHPYPYVDIHWMEVRLSAEQVPQAIEMCKRIGAAVEVGGRGIRIWGWIGPDDRPSLV